MGNTKQYVCTCTSCCQSRHWDHKLYSTNLYSKKRIWPTVHTIRTYHSFIQADSFFVYITARLCSAYSSGLVTGDLCDAACGVDSSSSSNNNNNHLDSVSCLGNHYGKHLVFSAELEGKEVGKRICINSIFISVLYAESPPSLSRWWSRARGATASAATPT